MDLPVNYNKLNSKERRKVREEYIELQKGKCYYCGNPLIGPPAKSVLRKEIHDFLFPPGFFVHPVHLHHDHETGMTLGAVHCVCNAVLWEHEGE